MAKRLGCTEYWTKTSSFGNWGLNGGGNSIIDETDSPVGEGMVWDVLVKTPTQTQTVVGILRLNIDNTKTYRFSVWIRRNQIGNGYTYLGFNALSSGNLSFSLCFGPICSNTRTNSYFGTSDWTNLHWNNREYYRRMVLISWSRTSYRNFTSCFVS